MPLTYRVPEPLQIDIPDTQEYSDYLEFLLAPYDADDKTFDPDADAVAASSTRL